MAVNNSVESGWIYCFSHKVTPGIRKIGMTTRDPIVRLKEANRGTYVIPEFEITIAKKVAYVKKKEKEIHTMLTNMGRRVSPRREFFKLDDAEVVELFDSLVGDYLVEETPKPSRSPKPARSPKSVTSFKKEPQVAKNKKHIITNVIKDLKNELIKVIPSFVIGEKKDPIVVTRADEVEKWCVDGDKVSHRILDKHTKWVGVYNQEKNKIIRAGQEYVSFAAFATAHYTYLRNME